MAELWIVTLVLGTVAILCAYLRGFVRFVYLTTKIQGPSLWELVTESAVKLMCNEEMLRYGVYMCERYGFKPFGSWFSGGYYVVFVSDSNSVGEVLKNKNFAIKSDFMYNVMAKYMGNGLTVLNGPEFQRHRGLLSPALRKSALENHLPRINSLVTKFVEEIRKNADGDVDMQSPVHDKTMSVAISVVSSGVASLTEVSDLFETPTIGADLIATEAMNPLWFLLLLKQTEREKRALYWRKIENVKKQTVEVMKRLATRLQKENRKPVDLLECMAQNEFTDEECFAEVCHFLAATETSEVTEQACLFLLALYPELQERAYEEQHLIFGDSDRPVEREDLSKMVYLEKVLKETMRLFPPVPSISRKVEEEINFNGILLPKGSAVVINFLALHRNPENFKDPLKFNPERFSPEESSGRHPFAYNPFSYGMRTCPGQQYAMITLKTSLSWLLRSFTFRPTEELKSIDDIRCKYAVLLALKNCTMRVFNRKVKDDSNSPK